jgi:hypothetical protein
MSFNHQHTHVGLVQEIVMLQKRVRVQVLYVLQMDSKLQESYVEQDMHHVTPQKHVMGLVPHVQRMHFSLQHIHVEPQLDHVM